MKVRLVLVWRSVLLALLLAGTSTARAAVELTFYSHEFGSNFPHAFVALKGVDDRTGERIDVNYGFTATVISPAILLGRVRGEIFSRDSLKDAGYLAASDRHFTLKLSDTEYDAVLGAVAKWRSLKQPSYDLNRQNCVHFVADIAATLGMRAEQPKALMKKPRSYTEMITRANLTWLEGRGATIHRQPRPISGSAAQTR